MTSFFNVAAASFIFLFCAMAIMILQPIMNGIANIFDPGLMRTVVKIMSMIAYMVLVPIIPIAIAMADKKAVTKYLGSDRDR